MSSYSFSIKTRKSPRDLFEFLLDVRNWWTGIYDETIRGDSAKIESEFSFSAGGGMHLSRQKLVELIPYKKITWEVLESDLSFLHNPSEWEGTKIIFDVQEGSDGLTKLTFTHQGLDPGIECYDQCSSAWTRYFQKLDKSLNNN